MGQFILSARLESNTACSINLQSIYFLMQKQNHSNNTNKMKLRNIFSFSSQKSSNKSCDIENSLQQEIAPVVKVRDIHSEFQLNKFWEKVDSGEFIRPSENQTD